MTVNEALLICYLRSARRKARVVATEEALSLLHDLQVVAPAGGPLSEQGGLFWLTLPRDLLEIALTRFPRLGYTNTIDLLEPGSKLPSSRKEAMM